MTDDRRVRRFATATTALVLAGASAIGPGAGPAGAATCTTVPGTGGLNAALLVTTPSTVTGLVDAAACDIGIYVGPGADGTVIDGATVKDSHAEGVLIQRVSDVVLRNSTITGSSWDAGEFGQFPPKAVMLAGTTRVLVADNHVVGNFGGGVGVNDDGPIHPATLAAGVPTPGVANVVRGNHFQNNTGGCAVVVASYNAGQGVHGNLVKDNLIVGQTGVFGPHGPDIAAIVVAANTPNSLAHDNKVLRNTVRESFIPGIIIHANAPGALATGTEVINNVLDRTGWGRTDGPPHTVGVAVATQAPRATIDESVVAGNRIDGVEYGIWLDGDVRNTEIGGYGVNHADQKVVHG